MRKSLLGSLTARLLGVGSALPSLLFAVGVEVIAGEDEVIVGEGEAQGDEDTTAPMVALTLGAAQVGHLVVKAQAGSVIDRAKVAGALLGIFKGETLSELRTRAQISGEASALRRSRSQVDRGVTLKGIAAGWGETDLSIGGGGGLQSRWELRIMVGERLYTESA